MEAFFSGIHRGQVPHDSKLNDLALEIPYNHLVAATQNFSDSCKLGAGSYGAVYKGLLQDTTEVAVKVMNVPDEAGFEDEVRVLSKFRHPNLVTLMGFSRNGSQRLLVYEMLSGGDVHHRLQKCLCENVPFTWKERLSVALDAARGLCYMHSSNPRAFHRDIKAPNILLDRKGTAKMADFGLACTSKAEAFKVKQASGTIGYACPYYIQEGTVTEKSEVYSFGMVLFELLTAKAPAYPGPNGQVNYLANHINGDVGKALQLVDVKAEWPSQVAEQVVRLALSCTSMQLDSRPTSSGLVKILLQMVEASETVVSTPVSNFQQSPVHNTPVATPVYVHRAPPVYVAQHQGGGGWQSVGGYQQRVVPNQPAYTPQFPISYVNPQPQEHVPAAAPSPSPVHQDSPVPKFSPMNGHHAHPQLSPPAKPAQPVQQAPPRLLFALECIAVEGRDVKHKPLGERVICHYGPQGWNGRDDLPPLHVGRLWQQQFFDSACADANSLSAISREHFDIELRLGVHELDQFELLLTNKSGNGTWINQQLLAKGQYQQIFGGDQIVLVKSCPGSDSLQAFITLVLDVSRSCLRLAPRPERIPEFEMPRAEAPAADPVDPNFAFELEIRGPGVDESIPVGERRLRCPLVNGEFLGSHIVVGRECNGAFNLPRVLVGETSTYFSRRHFEVYVTSQGYIVCKNLSSNGVFINNERNALTRRDAEHVVNHGDAIFVKALVYEAEELAVSFVVRVPEARQFKSHKPAAAWGGTPESGLGTSSTTTRAEARSEAESGWSAALLPPDDDEVTVSRFQPQIAAGALRPPVPVNQSF
mmetsp:Transcript_6344/g.15358  ORF Transcript_6344/g.15358 Transcript_6344/m.15358 type:complete len:814 (+) Transcript_6344:94-2535(+)